MSRLRPLFLLFAALILAHPALAGDVARDDLPRTLFERQYKVIENYREGTAGSFAGSTAMADGGVAVFGGMEHKQDGRSHLNPWILRFSAQGKLLWQREYEAPGHSTNAFSAAGLPDGGVLVVGIDRRLGQRHRFGGLVMRLSDKGVLVWRRVIAPAGSLRFRGIAAALDGGAVVVGEIEKPGVRGDNSAKPFLVRIDAKGNPVWQEDLPAKRGSFVDQVHAAGDDSFVVLGSFSTEERGYEGTVTALGIAGDGQVLWRKDFGPAGERFRVSYAYAPGAGFAVMHAVNKHTLVVERWNADRQLLWSMRDTKIADETKAKELYIAGSPMLPRPNGGLIVALATPVDTTAPKALSVLLGFDAAGKRTISKRLEMPAEFSGLFPYALSNLGIGGIAVVGQTVFYTRHGYYPRATTQWIRGFAKLGMD